MNHSQLAFSELNKIKFASIIKAAHQVKTESGTELNYIAKSEAIRFIVKLQKAIKNKESIEISGSLIIFTEYSSYMIKYKKGYLEYVYRSTNFKKGKGDMEHLMIAPVIINPDKTIVYRKDQEFIPVSQSKFAKALEAGELEIIEPRKDIIPNYLYDNVSNTYFKIKNEKFLESLTKKEVKSGNRVINKDAKSIFFIIKLKNGTNKLIFGENIRNKKDEVLMIGYGNITEANEKLNNLNNINVQNG